MTTKKSVGSERTGASFGPLAVGLAGSMVTVAAFVALIIAGLAAADLFPANPGAADTLQDRGVWSATRAWANPVAIVGLAVLFAGAVPYALGNIRKAISHRRDAMASALPLILMRGTSS